jgi:hypothetical protein
MNIFFSKLFIFNSYLIKNRSKVLQKLKEPFKQELTELNQALNNKV